MGNKPTIGFQVVLLTFLVISFLLNNRKFLPLHCANNIIFQTVFLRLWIFFHLQFFKIASHYVLYVVLLRTWFTVA